MAGITVALPKGKLLDGSLQLFQAMGSPSLAAAKTSRRLIFQEPEGGLRFILAKPNDVPIYVEYGAADMGIVGRDVLYESERDVYEPLSLGFGFCRLVVAGPPSMAAKDLRLCSSLRIATKYPRLARRHFLERGISVEVVPLTGSVEIAPAVGLADLIVDLVETGRTLRQNGLVEIEQVMVSEACLIVNRASHKLHFATISQIINQIASRTSAVRGMGQ
ncbi:MAG: ATP phosphoribosyltransferase [Chloroflexi bacterium]|nr:ATP phosphoribosyltransferase [Chloroflexota bacterium]